MRRLRWTLFLAAILAAFAALGALLAGCPSSGNGCAPRVVTTTQSCSTTQDCINAGYKGLTCINKTCARGCTRDDDCQLEDPADQSAACKNMASSTVPTFICESELCVNGCPDAPCASGEQCVNGRCAIFAEGFELRAGMDVVTPKSIGWDNDGRMLDNNRTEIVTSGPEGCTTGDERCAGVSGEGVRFVSLERTPTPAHSTPTTAVTCRACACCLECRLNPPANGSLAQIPTCPGAIGPGVSFECAAQAPAVCASICNDCSACMSAAGRMVGMGLLTCESDVAPKTCGGCVAYDSCVADQVRLHSCSDTNEPCAHQADCHACVIAPCDAMRPGCFACRDAIQCDNDSPGSAACRTLHQTCDAQGNDGCYETPIDRQRSQLSDDEQSLSSPEIPAVMGVTGKLTLQFEYVPFNVGEKYRRVVQEVPPADWPIEDQQVVVQLCGGACDHAESWVTGKLSTGADATFPPSTQRRNGLSFGGQSQIDWRSNRIEVDIPESLRTAGFRFRFVPQLDDDVRVGIDNVLIRRR